MANPSVLNADTKLFAPHEPKGRVFLAGEPWPGDVWSAKPGGKPSGETSAVSDARAALKEANASIERLESQAASHLTDKDRLAAERDDAVNAKADLEQRAIAAEKAQAETEERAKTYMTERDAARADAKRFSDAVDVAKATIAKLVAEGEADKQTIADLNGQIARSGGQAPAPKPAKPRKSAKRAAAAAADAG